MRIVMHKTLRKWHDLPLLSFYGLWTGFINFYFANRCISILYSKNKYKRFVGDSKTPSICCPFKI